MIPTHLVSHIIILLGDLFTCPGFKIVSASDSANLVQLSLGEACDPSDDKCAATSSCQNVTWLEYDSSYDDGSEIIPGDDYYEDMVEGNICARDW